MLQSGDDINVGVLKDMIDIIRSCFEHCGMLDTNGSNN